MDIQIIKEYIQKLPKEIVGQFNDYENFIDLVSKRYKEVNILTVKIQTLLVLIGIKHFQYLADYLVQEASVTRKQAEEITGMFFKMVIEPIQNIYLSTMLKIYSGEEFSIVDPDELLILEALFSESKEVVTTINEMAVPLPPEFISPRATNEDRARIEKIRPKPHQGTGDPYREEPK